MINVGAFKGCSSLRVVILVDGIKTIEDGAFGRCALEEILLPATLTVIGVCAFGSSKVLLWSGVFVGCLLNR